MAIPSFFTWDVGSNPTKNTLDTRIRDAINFLKNPPHAVLRRTTSQTIANDFGEAVQWTSEDKDSDNGHSTVTNPQRYTVATTGTYYLTASVVFANTSGVGHRHIYFRLNGDTNFRWGWQSDYPGVAGSNAQICLLASAHMRLELGDWVEVIAHQNSGGTLDIVSSNQDPRFEIMWVGM